MRLTTTKFLGQKILLHYFLNFFFCITKPILNTSFLKRSQSYKRTKYTWTPWNVTPIKIKQQYYDQNWWFCIIKRFKTNLVLWIPKIYVGNIRLSPYLERNLLINAFLIVAELTFVLCTWHHLATLQSRSFFKLHPHTQRYVWNRVSHRILKRSWNWDFLYLISVLILALNFQAFRNP